ncbi:MAG TPA: hypothetical protein VIF09_18220, partial [Polyangiaceae bacterium]
YASAYSVVPGRIHVSGLRIRGRDSNVEWVLTLERCDFRVSFRDLLRHRFHADHVRGDGLTMRIRQREPSFTADEAAALPPVPGFADPPLSGPKPPPLSDADYNLWSIWLEDVVADHVREIWVDTIRYSGDLQIRGRWFFRPVRWLDIGPATVTAHDLDVSHGPREPWVAGAMGQIIFTLHPFDVRVPVAEALHQASVDGDLRAVAQVDAIANHLLGNRPVHIDAAKAEVEVHVAIDHGVPRPGTQGRLAGFAARGSADDIELDATLEAQARVDEGSVAHVRAEGQGLRVSQAGFLRGEVARIAGTLRSSDLDLARRFFGDATGSVDVRELRTDSLRYWHGRLPFAPWLVVDSRSMSASGHAEGSLAERVLTGQAELDVHSLTLAGDGARIEGNLAGTLHLSARLREHAYNLSGSALKVDSVQGTMHGVAAFAPRVTIQAPRLVVAEAGVLGRVEIDVPSIEVPSLAPLGTVLHLPRGIVIESGLARGGGHLDVDLAAGTAAGEAHVVAPALRVRMGSQTLRGALSLALRAHQEGLRTDVSGTSLQFRAPGTGWWASADLPDAELTLHGGARLDARVDLRARDASPISALLAEHAGLATNLAVALVPTSGLRATGEIVARPSAFEARSFVVRADGFDLDLELAQLGGERAGAAFVVVGAIQAGVDLNDHPEAVRLFGADSWFARRRAALRTRERAYE